MSNSQRNSKLPMLHDVFDSVEEKRSKLSCPDCPFTTRSERVFTEHLTNVHAYRPEQVGRAVAKQTEVR